MEKKEYNCKICGTKLIETLTNNSIHHARLDCPKCKLWRRWIKKPTTKEKKRKQTTKHNITYDFCRMCGRTKEKLGDKEVLILHHMQPLEEGGKDIKENIIILCTACHRLHHWARLHMNNHLKKFKRG